MLQKLFSIIKSTLVRMVLRSMEYLIVILNHVNLDMQVTFIQS